ncbi:unnamed protein product [Bursaphelenchus xylophilus]|uniref:(pine wood nematode) hypothetical protein n=1 Tax=Bursaphelenchus xylophilus TaxID=6326 RepID=A0A1I7S8J3_BURXY|nr:unnamed protein product [Bursaphelenchus xylophilus]CAG9121129.1 unnamed protein product [Bursaphelenchus xylophilus]
MTELLKTAQDRLDDEKEKWKETEKTVLLGIDTVKALDADVVKCLQHEEINFVIFRLAQNGKNDQIGLNNMKISKSARLPFYAYIDPNPYADGAVQLNEALDFAAQNDIKLQGKSFISQMI